MLWKVIFLKKTKREAGSSQCPFGYKAKKLNLGLRENSDIFRSRLSAPSNNSHLLTYLPALCKQWAIHQAGLGGLRHSYFAGWTMLVSSYYSLRLWIPGQYSPSNTQHPTCWKRSTVALGRHCLRCFLSVIRIQQIPKWRTLTRRYRDRGL